MLVIIFSCMMQKEWYVLQYNGDDAFLFTYDAVY